MRNVLSHPLLVLGLAVTAVTAMLSGEARPRKLPAVTDDVIAKPSANDWLSWRGTVRSLGYSALTQINRGNVAHLQIAWTHTMKAGQQEAAPIVHDGVIYLAEPGGTVEAL